jgi:hypothetical protein
MEAGHLNIDLVMGAAGNAVPDAISPAPAPNASGSSDEGDEEQMATAENDMYRQSSADDGSSKAVTSPSRAAACGAQFMAEADSSTL